MHDIGKVGIPDHILRKPGRLTPDEWRIMQKHAKLGSDALGAVQSEADRQIDFLGTAKDIAHWHHERWDGSGYPDGLSGEQIPLAARLMSLADVYDALISRRVYKNEFDPEHATQMIIERRGLQFDPDVVDAFLAERDVFLEIARKHANDDELSVAPVNPVRVSAGSEPPAGA